MRSLKFKLVLGIATVLILGLLTTMVAKAYSQCYPSSSNCLTYAVYYHGVHSGPGSYWEASVMSKTASPIRTMDHLGYTYWGISQWCNTTMIKNKTYGGHVHYYTSMYWATSLRLKYYCSGHHWGSSLGNHDFYDWPYDFFRPYSYKSGDI